MKAIKYSVFLNSKHIGDVMASTFDDAYAEAESEYGESDYYEISVSEEPD